MTRLIFYILFSLIISNTLLSEYSSYIVKKGDTLYSIATKHSMAMDEFLRINKIKNADSYKIKVNQKLKVELNEIFTLAYDKETKTYAMLKVEKPKTSNNASEENSKEDSNKVEEKEVIVAKDNTVANEERVITTQKTGVADDIYTVVKGDTLYGIAFKHDMKVSDFLALNDIKDSSKYNLMVGTKLKIKKTVANNPSNTTEAKKENTTRKVEKIETYTAQKGDTLYGIAFKHNMKVSDFLALNDIKDSSKYNLMVGAKLKVKKTVEEKVVVSSPSNTTEAKKENTTKKVEKIETYTAQKGDTLYGIAFKHDMKVSDFLALNDIKDSSKYNLMVGTKLKVKKTVEEKISTPSTKESTVAKADNTAPVSNNSNRLIESYTAKNGDTLSEIAEYFGMDLIDVYVLNKLDNKYVLKVGDKLYVYKRVATDYNTKKYTVKSGDTLYSIARNNNMSLDDLLNINNIDLKKYTLQSGTQLKVYKKETIATAKVNNQEEIITRVAGASSSDDTVKRPDISLSWPYRGSVVETYGVKKDKIANRGINISGNSGDKVMASYEGIVEYVGTIRGFGNVVIIKHADNYTTSYAHLSSSSVKVGDFVNKGDKIGAIGNTGVVDKNELYFKVSYLGMPINPLLVLPKS